MTTPFQNSCECDIPDGGFCERHGVNKPPHFVKLCRTKKAYWLAWEQGRGPEQSITQRQTKTVIIPKPKKAKKKRPILLGDMVSNALAMVGITEERVTKMIGRPCGCGRRKRKLNQLHLWAKRVLSGKTENAEEYLREMMDETP